MKCPPSFRYHSSSHWQFTRTLHRAQRWNPPLFGREWRDFFGITLGGCYTREFGLWRSLASALAWGARGPEFKSRQPDQISHRPTDSRPPQYPQLESIWSPKVDASVAPQPGVPRTIADSRIFTFESSRALSCRRNPQTRQIAFKSLKPQGRSLSGRPENPTKNPTNRVR